MVVSAVLVRNRLAHIIKKWTIATVQVVYYIPDHLHIVNQFMWQTEDQFLLYKEMSKTDSIAK